MTANPVIVEPVSNQRKQLRWNPQLGGAEVTGVVEKKLSSDAAAQGRVQESAGHILGHSIPPGQIGSETGLVVGYVQSGKTLSFTAVAALARDNGFQLIIVIAGSSIQLSEQSRDRLRLDLRITPDRPRTWSTYHNPRQSDADNIQRILDEWRNSTTPLRQTVLITVMKQHKNLQHVIDLLSALNLSGISTLIIDDEADQASLNNEVPEGTQSSTYQKLLQLRAGLPSQTLLQYTATPQAPLLINIIDTLSPNFVEVLDPGPSYTGGKDFFINSTNLVRIIPPSDVPTRQNQLSGPPESLLEALRIFLIGVAAGLKLSGGAGNRSMLIHPSHGTAPHQEFKVWVSDIFEAWRQVIKAKAEDPDREQLLGDFRNAYSDLAKTEPSIPPFDELVGYLSSAFNMTNIEEVNRRQGRPVIIDWSRQYGWILVGGQAMDRGYTIEGLTVTYMPRGIGTGQADTIQQRARFFGYKKEYLGYCRVYLEAQTRAAFHAYVEHEEFMRQQLKQVASGGRSLNEWKRAFVLDPALRPCRDSVIEFDYIRTLMTSEWFAPSYMLADAETDAFNRKLVESFLGDLNLQPDEGDHRRTEYQKHRFRSDLSLRDVAEKLLTQFRVHDPIDSQKLIGVLIQLSKILEDGRDEPCAIYEMSSGMARERGVNNDGRILNLFQGAYPVAPKDKQGSIYPGDQSIHSPDSVTVQVHKLTLTRGKGPAKTVVRENVPVLAIWLPRRLAKPWLIQDQPGQPTNAA
jgi:hypothetical protein